MSTLEVQALEVQAINITMRNVFFIELNIVVAWKLYTLEDTHPF